ncbi:hypothetical protein [Paenibacillus sp. NPDC058071]|uniref:hypothetical protein n=1 Tax=Paenibacillus sp. NPDC058071 TaxID=3346326 RepID=UPI0036D990F3
MKQKQEALTENLVAGLIGQHIQVPENMVEIPEAGKQNVWFAGRVAGYEKAVFGFNPSDGSFMEEPFTYLSVVMTDGKGYILAEDCCINAITEQEFKDMLAEHVTKQSFEESAESSTEVDPSEAEALAYD